MKICVFGSYVNSDFNNLLIKILKKKDVEIIEIQEPVKGISSFFSAIFKLIRRHSGLEYDFMVIPWRGIITLPLAKIISKKPIIYFPFLSIYQTLIEDRKTVKKNSIKAKVIHFIENRAYKLSDLVIVDTNTNIDYICNEFGFPKEKLKRLFLSLDETIFFPLPIKQRKTKFKLLFIGSFIPLHGIETIVEAAKKLSSDPSIQFDLIGTGQTRNEIENLISKYNLNNIFFHNPVPLGKLNDFLKDSDVCLGIFSKNKKAMSIIPHKVFIALGTQKPLITSKSPAISEIGLENFKDCILVNPNDPDDLVNAIMLLKNKPELCEKIAKSGYDVFSKKLSMEKIGNQLLDYLNEL